MEKIFGEKNAEDKAADKMKDAADGTADAVGDAREKSNDDDKTLVEALKEKVADAVDNTKEYAHAAKETLFGERPAEEERKVLVFNPKENVHKSEDIFKGIRDSHGETNQPHPHDY